MTKSVHLLVSVLFISLLIIGCSSDNRNENNQDTSENNVTEDDVTNNMQSQGDYEIHLGGEMIETENGIIIEGESNLLPGSYVTGEVKVVEKNVSMYLLDSTEELDFFADETEIVKDDGSFYLELEHPKMNKETIVSVKFTLDEDQNEEVLHHYGNQGEKLEGPFIYQHVNKEKGYDRKNINQKAEVTTTFTPNKDNKAVRQFQEPNWSDIPDDMGDPNVWIEVDEVNDDGSYQYIHGRSNLIEGSRLIIKPGLMKVAETAIEKDGSFYFKYDYKERDSTVIIFDPSDLQWGIVEETYGETGQKLEGELAGPDQTEQKQIIEYEVELVSQEIEVPDHVDMEMNNAEITLLVPDDILFDFDKYELKDNAKKTLQDLGDMLVHSFNKEDFVVDIEGHTDNVGDNQYNQELSEKRATEVKEFFENQLKDTNVSFTTKGYGSRKPIASNDNKSGQAKNRRVEIIINLK